VAFVQSGKPSGIAYVSCHGHDGKSAAAAIKCADAKPLPFCSGTGDIFCRVRFGAANARAKARQPGEPGPDPSKGACEHLRGIRSRLCQDRGIVHLRQNRRQCQHRRRGFALTFSKKARIPVQLDIIVPVLMSCALLWWVSRGMTWTMRLAVAAATLVLIVCVLLIERSIR
jgi:hypothetical protein